MRRVYNVTPSTEIEFYGRMIPPNGGHVDIPQLGSFIPTRDQQLEKDRMIAFDHLPQWFLDKRRMDEETSRKEIETVKALPTVAEMPKAMAVPDDDVMIVQEETTFERRKRK